jgi:hypothetical protein
VADPIEHAWMAHFDRLEGVYFPDQSPRYHNLCLRQIHLALGSLERMPEDQNVKCTLCDHEFTSFHAFYRHSRLVHTVEAEQADLMDPRTLMRNYMAMFGEVAELHCVSCDVECQNEENLIEHCWQMHGEGLAYMLKHRPIGYQDDTFEKMFGLGVKCLNEIAAGQIWHGSIACGMCKIGFDHPGELFIHLFHRHSRVCAVRAGAMPEWPIRGDRLVAELQAVLKRICGKSAGQRLVEAEVFEKDGEQCSCRQCSVSFKDKQEMWSHIESCHLLITF